MSSIKDSIVKELAIKYSASAKATKSRIAMRLEQLSSGDVYDIDDVMDQLDKLVNDLAVTEMKQHILNELDMEIQNNQTLLLG